VKLKDLEKISQHSSLKLGVAEYTDFVQKHYKAFGGASSLLAGVSSGRKKPCKPQRSVSTSLRQVASEFSVENLLSRLM
jgi:hypothetical protein